MLKRVTTVSLVIFILQTTAALSLAVLGNGHSTNSSASVSNSTISNSTTASTGNSIKNGKKISDTELSQRGKSSQSSRHGKGSSPKKHSSTSAKFSSGSFDSYMPIGYRYKYASDYDSYVSTSYSSIGTDLSSDIDVDLDLDLLHVHEPIWFPLHYDVDLDLDLDLDDIDLDLDLLKLKYGLYGLNHYSLHNPNFNDYRFRRRYRYHSRPYFRAQHRYLPQYWKHDLDFWGLDNYGLGFSYDKFLYLDTPISYSSISTF